MFGSKTGQAIGSWLSKAPGLKSKPGQLLGKIVLDTAEEIPGEGAAAYGQAGAKAEAGEATGLDLGKRITLGEGIAQTYKSTITATLLQGGAIGGAQAAGNRLIRKDAEDLNQKADG